MKIIINNSSMQPIYEQIVQQIKELIVSGSLARETMLPSVRGLAKELKISALTVKKVYDCLEQEGFVLTVHGKGSFVAGPNANLMLEQRRKEAEQEMENAVRKAKIAGMDKSEIRELLELIMEEQV